MSAGLIRPSHPDPRPPLSLKWAGLVLVIALIARLGAAMAIGSSFRFADEAIYLDSAQRLAGGTGFGANYNGVPAYPVFLAMLSLGLPLGLGFFRAAQALVAALGSLVVFTLADRMFGRRAAFAASVTYALDPLLVVTAGLLYPESVAAVVLAVIVLLALDASERDVLARSGLAGALLAVLAMFRPVALILPPVVGGWIALTTPARPARRLAHLGLVALAFLLVLAPWAARNYRIHAQLIPPNLAGTHTAPVARAEAAEQGLVVSVARWAWHDPAALVSRVSRQFVQFWELAPTRLVTDDPVRRERLHQRDPRLPVQPLFSHRLRDQVSIASFGLELALAIVGLVSVLRSRRRQSLLAVAVIFTYAVGYALFAAKLRYRIPILPLLFLFTGAGAAAVYTLIRGAAARGHNLAGSNH